MTLNELNILLNDCCNDISFILDGKPCGIIPEVANYKPIYHVWYGNITKDFYNAKDVLKMGIFNGRTLESICETIDFNVT